MSRGRPLWRKNIPLTKSVRVSGLNCPKGTWCLLQAILNSEKDLNFVPIDQTVLQGPTALLFLIPGKYTLTLVNSKNEIIENRSIRIY